MAARTTAEKLEAAQRALEDAHRATEDGQVAHWVEKARAAVREARRRAGTVLQDVDLREADQPDLEL